MINDKDGRKLGDPVPVMVTDYFVGNSDLTYTVTAKGDLIKSVMEDSDMPGKFIVTIEDLAGETAANGNADTTALDYPDDRW